jgi:hypothetical protein
MAHGDPQRVRALFVPEALCLLLQGGCSLGPRALERSHSCYNEAVRHVEEEELLRNIVHLRYTETPLHLKVNSIAAQYEVSASAEARPFFLAPNPSNSNVIFRTFTSILPDVMLGGANRPTITLDPADGSEAVRQFLTPITADTLTLLTQTGWPTSVILRLWVDRINGVPNAVTASGPRRERPSDFARFLRIAELVQAAQDQELVHLRAVEHVTEMSGLLPPEAVTATAAVEAAKNGLEYRRHADGKSWVLIRRTRVLAMEVAPGAHDRPEMAELIALLNLAPSQRRYEIVVTERGTPDPARFPLPPSPELRVDARSTAQVLFYLANGVEVPPDHLCAGLVGPTVDADGRVFDDRAVTRGLFEVHLADGHKPPRTAFVAIKYRGYWYYIDDRDQSSKATFALMMQLSRLDFARPLPGAPLLTLPVGR